MMMKSPLYKTSLAVLFFMSLSFAAQHVVIDDLKIVDNELCVSYHINELLNDKSVDALQRGIKSEVVHNIQLWQQKSFINPLEKDISYSIKVSHDAWEKKYKIETNDESRLTSNLETVKHICTFVENLPLAGVDELETDKKYHLSIDVTFQLISAESYNAISDIFSGDKKEKVEGKKKSRFVSIFVNLLGFGDKDFSLKTQNFIITKSGKVEFVQ